MDPLEILKRAIANEPAKTANDEKFKVIALASIVLLGKTLSDLSSIADSLRSIAKDGIPPRLPGNAGLGRHGDPIEF